MDEKDKGIGRALSRDPRIRVKEIARCITISVTAPYHPILGGRGAVLDHAT